MTLKQLVSKVILSGKRDAMWNYLSPLDFSFLSRKVESVLTFPEWKTKKSAKSSDKTMDRDFDNENTLRAGLSIWKQEGSIRSVLVNDNIKDGEDHAFVVAHEVKLVSLDETSKVVKYVITSPEMLRGKDAVHSFRVLDGTDGVDKVCVEITSEYDESVDVFIQAYHAALTSSMSKSFDSLNGTFAYPYAPRRATFDNYVLEMNPNVDFVAKAQEGKPPTVADNVISDPYRFLEDPDSNETKEWIESQNVLTKTIMDTCDAKTGIFNSLKTMFEYRRVGNATLYGKYWYFSMNNGLQNQSPIYQAPATFVDGVAALPIFADLEKQARVFLDPNVMGDNTAIGSLEFNGVDTFGFQSSKNGSDWKTVHLLHETATPETPLLTAGEKDVISHVKFSGLEWLKDGSGFFYSRYPPVATADLGTETSAAINHSLYFHQVGTTQEEDVLVWSNTTNDQWMCNAQVSECGVYVIATINDSCDRSNMVWITTVESVRKTKQTDKSPIAIEWTRLVDTFVAEFRFLSNNGTTFYFSTNLNAPKGRVLSLDIASSLTSSTNKHTGECFTGGKTTFSLPTVELIPESAGVLEDAVIIGDVIVTNVLQDVQNKLQVFTITGDVVDSSILTNGLPSLSTLVIHGERAKPYLYITAVSFTSAGVTFTYNTQTKQLVQFNENKPKNFDSGSFTVSQQFAPSEDGKTKIPMFLIHKKNLVRDGTNPVFLYGYGGFNISLPPSFSPSNLGYLNYLAEQNTTGVVAICNLRGGGEYGDAWHEAGTKTHKMNVFRDFKDCAKYLCDEKYTHPGKIGIHGRSNGGLLVGASSVLYGTQFYGAAVASVGVLDMLRFSNFTIGYAWESDYGYVNENQDEFDAICEYSPYHNYPKNLPPLLVNTASHDDRVSPNHSFKFSAAMQRAAAHGSHPAVIRIETNSGHGAGKPLDKVIQEQADIFAFIAKYTNATVRN